MKARRFAVPAILFALSATSCAHEGVGEPGAAKPVAPREPGRTVFLPHRAASFDPSRENAIWCATFAMAWDALGRDVLKGPVTLGPPAPAGFVDGMNAHPFPPDALDPASCIALAGTREGGVLDRISREGKEKFGRPLPEMDIRLDRPDDILAYAFLLKDLPFEHPFETIEGGVAFPGAQKPVAAFGLRKGGTAEVRRQVRILYWTVAGPGQEPGSTEEEQFVLELTPKGGRDRILLARVGPGSSLEATWRKVAADVGSVEPAVLDGSARLEVPRIRFDIRHSYSEIVGSPLLNEGFGDYRVAEAAQSILFRFDEAGALLKSEAAILHTKGIGSRRRPQIFLFDRPFLIALEQKGASEPYFLMWVANPDLMPK